MLQSRFKALLILLVENVTEGVTLSTPSKIRKKKKEKENTIGSWASIFLIWAYWFGPLKLTALLWILRRNGVQQRKNSYQDGVYGTTCPIPPGKNFTYRIQVKDQIGTYFYFPSLAFHKAAGGFGSIRVLSRPLIPVPFPEPAADYTLLIGDWYTANHSVMNGSNFVANVEVWMISLLFSDFEEFVLIRFWKSSWMVVTDSLTLMELSSMVVVR